MFYDIKDRLCLAPLAGWTDRVFRQLCRRFGADMVFTELVSADGLIHHQARTWEYVRFEEHERPIGIQLFGSDPKVLAGAVEQTLAFDPDVIDLNFGCSVKKVVKRGAGAAMLADLERLYQCARAVVRASGELPVSAKIRSGWEEDQTDEVARCLEDAGIAALTVHPRTAVMQFRGRADWQIIRRVKKRVSIPVIGNGDIRSAADARRMKTETGCDAIMIGRASLGNPWIFQQIQCDRQGRTPVDPPPSLRMAVCIEHSQQAVTEFGETRALRTLRKHMVAYTKGWPDASTFRRRCFQTRSWADCRRVMDEYKRHLEETETVTR